MEENEYTIKKKHTQLSMRLKNGEYVKMSLSIEELLKIKKICERLGIKPTRLVKEAMVSHGIPMDSLDSVKAYCKSKDYGTSEMIKKIIYEKFKGEIDTDCQYLKLSIDELIAKFKDKKDYYRKMFKPEERNNCLAENIVKDMKDILIEIQKREKELTTQKVLLKIRNNKELKKRALSIFTRAALRANGGD